MKRRMVAKMAKVVILFLAASAYGVMLHAQPAPGMNGDSTLVGGGPLSGGVPLGSGVFFFLLFGIGYGIRKWLSEKKKGH